MSARTRHLLLVFLTTTLGAGLAQGQTAAPDAKPADAKPPEPYTITGNFGIYSQYVFRGLTQTDQKPALQGGF
ncbi:MAG: TorF family putative porin, partial [bacterium]